MSALEDYQKAILDYQQAKIACTDMVTIITRANASLSNWRTVTVTNVSSKFPNELYDLPHQAIDAQQWPDAETLTRTLEQFHFSRQEMTLKRNAIPMPERMAVIPLPD